MSGNSYQPTDSYYDPYNNMESQSKGVGSAIAGAAKNMVVYGLMMGVAGAVGKIASSGIGAGIKSIANKAAPAAAFTKALNSAYKPGVSTVVRSMLPGGFKAGVSQSLKPYRDAVLARSSLLTSLKSSNPLAADARSITSIFKNKHTAVGVAGKYLKENVYSSALAGYAIDSVLGNTKSMGLESKKLYDLPGHVSNFAKWLPNYAISGGVFKAFGRTAQTIKGQAGLGMQSFLKNNPAARDGILSMMPKVGFGHVNPNIYAKSSTNIPNSKQEQNFVSKSFSAMKGATGAFVQSLVRNARTYFTESMQKSPSSNHSQLSFGGRLGQAKDSVKRIIQETKDIWNVRREKANLVKAPSPGQTPGIGLIDSFDQLSKQSFVMNSGQADGIGFLNEGLNKYNKHSSVSGRSFFGEVLGLQKSKVGDVLDPEFISRISETMGRYAPTNAAKEQFMSNFVNSGMGKHYYKVGSHGSNLSYDLSVLDPIHRLKALGRGVLNANMNIMFNIYPTGKNMNLGSLTGMSTIFSESPNAAFLSKENKSLGLIVDDSSGRPKTLSQLATDRSVDKDFGVIMLGNHYYGVDGQQITKLDTRHGVLKMSNAGILGGPGEAKVSANKRYIYENRNLDDINKADKARSNDNPNLFTSFFRKMDWEMPHWAKTFSRAIKKKLTPGRITHAGKQLDYNQELYAASAEAIFGSAEPGNNLKGHVSTLREMVGHSTQEQAGLLNRPYVLAELGAEAKARLGGDIGEVMWTQQGLMSQLKNLDREMGVGKTLFQDDTFASAYNYALAFPSDANKHIVAQRLGRLSDMNTFDFLKTKYISAVTDDIARANNGIHPMATASDVLLKKGFISPRQAQGMKTHARMSSFINDPDFMEAGLSSSDMDYDTAIRSAARKVRDVHNTVLEDTINYISDTPMREPSNNIVKLKNRQLFGFEDLPSELKLAGTSKDLSPYVFMPASDKGGMDISSGVRSFGMFSERLSKLIFDIGGLKKDMYKYSQDPGGQLKYYGTRAIQAAGIGMAYRTLDTFFAANPVFNGTILDGGLTSAGADQIAKARLMTGRLADITGITGINKYLEGVMPGFTSSAPGAFIGAAINWKSGLMGTMSGVVQGAIANRMLSPLMPDMTKSYDQLKKEYSGEMEVPIIRNKMWVLGTTPWQGAGVEGYAPNWYVKTKSRWEASDTLYGSEFRRWLHKPIFPINMSLGDIVDPYYMERKHYHDRPYPQTGEFGKEVPLGVGSVLAATVGRIIKPRKVMHSDYIHGQDFTGDTPDDPGIKPPSAMQHRMMMHGTGVFNPRKLSSRGTFDGNFIYGGSKNYGQILAQDALGDLEEGLGLIGFMSGTARNAIAKSPLVVPTLESAAKMSSMARSYNDMNFGGVGIFCLPDDELVLTNKYLVPVQSLCSGDIVVDKNFDRQRIINKFSRICDEGEKLFTITVNAAKTQIKLTGNHPVAIYKKNGCNDNKARPCIPGYSKKCNRCSKRSNPIDWEWTPAEEINTGDFAVMPLPKINNDIKIDLGLYTDRGVTDNYIYFGSNEFAAAYELLESGACCSRKQLTVYVDDESAKEALYSFRHNKVRRYKRHHIINNDIAYFLGWWLTEGSSNVKTGEVRFTLNINERNIADKLSDIISSEFGIKARIYEYADTSVCVVAFKFRQLALYLKKYGNVHTKRLYDLISLPDEQASYLLDGLINGDGWLNNKKRCGGFTSVSSDLVRDIWLLCYRLGVQSTITLDYLERAKDNGLYPQGSPRKDSRRSYLKFNGDGYKNIISVLTNKSSNGVISNGICFTTEKYLFIKIADIKSEDYSGKTVHDIEVENSHCFVGNYVLLHNSEPIRRFISKGDNEHKLDVNAIPNLLPNWLPAKYLSGDPFSKIISGELRLPGCITPESLILTSKGLKRADEIVIGDKTLTLDGFKDIEYVIPSYKNEDIYEIDAYSGLPVSVTGNHHVLAIKTQKCKYVKSEPINKRPCKPFASDRKFCNKLKCTDCVGYMLDWYPVDQLSPADYLVLPKIKKDKTITHIRTVDFLKKSNIEKTNDGYITYNYLNNKKRYNKKLKFPDNIELNKDVMYFIGYYIAEGCINKTRNISTGITITVSDNELHILKYIQKTVLDNFGINSTIYKYSSRGNCYDLKINSVILSKIIDSLVGSVDNKHINPNLHNLEYLIAGLFDGDATISKESIILTASKKYRYSTDLLNILLQLNIPYSIREKNSDVYVIKIPLYKINEYLIYKKVDHLTKYTSKSSTIIELDDIFLIKIRSINKKHYKGKVYDFQVKDEHNYTTSFLMHNSSYEKTHAGIKHSMPARSSMLGGSVEEMAQYFSGMADPILKEQFEILESGTEAHERIQNWLASENMLISAEALIYDVKRDISGHVDAVIRDGYGGKGRRALEIKTINDHGFKKLDGPKWQHASQLNFYLDQLKLKQGSIMYVNRDNPSEFKTFDLTFDRKRLVQDFEKLKHARYVAGDMITKKITGDAAGFSYSWVDRLKILADVAPTSKEYAEAKLLVEKQIKSGTLTQKEISKYELALKHREHVVRKYEMYPLRFKGKIMSPDSEANIQSLNENIKAAAEYSLPMRAVGAAWETLTNTNSFLTNKFFAFKDPLEHYKQYRLYGKEFTPWNDPYETFLAPNIRNILGSTGMRQGATSGGLGLAYLFGGMSGAVYGGIAGAVYGTLNGLAHRTTGATYIPNKVSKLRELEDQFDTLKYDRSHRMAELTFGSDADAYAQDAQQTLHNLINNGNGSPKDIMRAASQSEKAYMSSWMNEKDPKTREEISRYAPPKISQVLQNFWRDQDAKEGIQGFTSSVSADIANGRKTTQYSPELLDPSILLDDIKLKTINEEGLNAHEFGIGWKDQLARVQNDMGSIPGLEQRGAPSIRYGSMDASAVKSAILAALNKFNIQPKIRVFINNHHDGANVLNITIQRDTSRKMLDSLAMRERFIK